MNTLTVRFPPSLDAAFAQASVREQTNKSVLVRRVVVAYLGSARQRAAPISALEQAGDLVGCFAGGPITLSCNPRQLDGFGTR